MSINFNFKPTPFLNTVIFSLSDSNTKYKGRLMTDLKVKEAQYKAYKENLNFKYGQFLKNIEGNISLFNNPQISSEVINDVAKKLSDLAQQRIVEKESKFSEIHKFFHKIGQLFKGHGFRTKGEWGVELSSRMEKVNSEIYKSQLKEFILEDNTLLLNKDLLFQEINGLSEIQFKHVINIVFEMKENLGFNLIDKNKLTFYKALNEQKRKIFDKALLSRDDWYEQAFDIIEGSFATLPGLLAEDSYEGNEYLKKFVSTEMISRFKEDPKTVIQIYKNQEDKNGWFIKFFHTIVGATIKSYLKNDILGNDSIKAVENLLFNDSINYKKILDMMTNEEREKLKKNIPLYSSLF